MEGDAERVKRAAREVGRQVGGKTGDKIKEIEQQIRARGGVPKDAFGLDDSMVEALYGHAYQLYSNGHYRKALSFFRLLVQLNATEAKYTMGQAACYHMMKDYRKAATTYSMCGLLDPENPIPHFHSSDCYLQLGDKLSAIVALEMALKRAGDKPHYRTLKERSQMTLQTLKDELQQKQVAPRPPSIAKKS